MSILSRALQLTEAVAALLVSHGVAPSEARYRSMWITQMYDKAGVEALTWNLAEAFWRAQGGGKEDGALVKQTLWTRGKFVALAQVALAEVKPYGEGLSDWTKQQQARANMLAHQCEVDEQRRTTAHEQVVQAESDRRQR